VQHCVFVRRGCGRRGRGHGCLRVALLVQYSVQSTHAGGRPSEGGAEPATPRGERVPCSTMRARKSLTHIKPNFLSASSSLSAPTHNVHPSETKLQRAFDNATRQLPISHSPTRHLLSFFRARRKSSVNFHALEIPISPRSRSWTHHLHLFQRATHSSVERHTAVYVFHALRQRFQTSAASQAANISHTSDTL